MAKKLKAKLGHNANYDFKQHAPETPMGHNSFANLPDKAMTMKLSGKWQTRDGIRNSPIASVDMISGVDENRDC